jgi:RNA polymerase sigma-70 factor (ECF subfamily)
VEIEGKTQHGIFVANRSALVDYATRILGSREAAEDIVQDAYLRFAPGKTTAVSARQAIAYLYRIVRNLALDGIKRRRIEVREQGRELPFWTVPQDVQTPEETMMFCDEVRVASDALASLPEEVRIAAEMHRFHGFTLEEVANHLDISVATAHRHVRTAMMRIAIALDMQKA